MKTVLAPPVRIWIVTVIILVGIGIIVFNSYQILTKNTAQAFNRQQLFLVKEAARGIERYMENLETSLKTGAALLAVASPETVLAALYANQRELVAAVCITDGDGNPLYYYPRTAAGLIDMSVHLKTAMDRAAAAGGSRLLSDVVVCHDNGATIIVLLLGVPLRTSGQWMCYVCDLTKMQDIFVSPIRSGETGYAWMIDNTGRLLAHPNRTMEGKRALDVLKELWPQYSDSNLEVIINKKMIMGEEGKGGYTGWHIGEQQQLTKKLIAYCPIKYKGILWSIGVSAPYREAMDPLLDSLAGPVAFLVCFVIIIVAGAFFIGLEERRKRLANQEIAWSNEVFDSITDGISIVDKDYRVLMVNKAVAEWQGKTQESFKGKHCYEVFQQQEDKCVGCPARQVFETGVPAFRERVSTTLAGRKYYFHLSAFPLKDKQGNTVKVAECVKDVTREMALRSELLQHERKAVIVKMSAQVAHEIRNPLGSLMLNIDLLEDELHEAAGAMTPEAVALVDTIKSEVDGLHRILQEYLECTRFPTIQPDKQNIGSVIEDLLSLLEEDLRRKKIVFRTGFTYNLPMAYVDRDQIHRAFLNILLNAMEAMDDGGTIEVTARHDGHFIEVVFQDSGAGIPEEQLEKIFTPFFTTKTGGTGLGLSISQHIITEHKGEIQCESNPGAGARFVVRLPQWQAAME